MADWINLEIETWNKPIFEVGDIVTITNVTEVKDSCKWILSQRAVVIKVGMSNITIIYPAHIVDKYGSREDKERKLNCTYTIHDHDFYRLNKVG